MRPVTIVGSTPAPPAATQGSGGPPLGWALRRRRSAHPAHSTHPRTAHASAQPPRASRPRFCPRGCAGRLASPSTPRCVGGRDWPPPAQVWPRLEQPAHRQWLCSRPSSPPPTNAGDPPSRSPQQPTSPSACGFCFPQPTSPEQHPYAAPGDARFWQQTPKSGCPTQHGRRRWPPATKNS
jgi:hypothetical protein